MRHDNGEKLSQKNYIHLIRHGITEANQKNLYYGYSDIPLAEAGVETVNALKRAGIYPKPESAVYYTSGLKRTEQTLSLIYGDVPRVRLDALKEMFFGEYELKSHLDLKGDPYYEAWRKDESGVLAPPGGESAKKFKERVKSGFKIILDSHSEGGEKHSVAVCHGGVICVIMMSCFPDHGSDMFKWIPEPGHGYTITVEKGLPLSYTSF